MKAQHIINHLEFSRKSLRIHDTIALSFFSKLPSLVLNPDALLQWSLQGVPADAIQNKPGLVLTMQSDMQFTCQRCLKPLAFHFAKQQRFELISDESDAPEDDDTELDFLVLSESFDVMQLIEEELILAIPFAPKHEHDCKLDGAPDLKQANSAFAVLKDLKLARH